MQSRSSHGFHLPPDKAKLSSCQVIVHCLAGISRSATIAIAYIMKTMGMSSDDAYRYLLGPGTWNCATYGSQHPFLSPSPAHPTALAGRGTPEPSPTV